jgi:signal transduction histidine kinase
MFWHKTVPKPFAKRIGMFVAQILWISIIIAIAIWWLHVLVHQITLISELKTQLHLHPALIAAAEAKTYRMLKWESVVFFGLLISLSSFIFITYWKDAYRNYAKTTFFTTLTHELKTPLASIRLQAEALQLQNNASHLANNLLKRLLEDVAKLEQELEKFLELTRLDSGDSVYLQPIAFHEWINYFVEQEYPNLNIHIELQGCHYIQADPFAIKLIFRNLIQNAITHSKADPLTIRIQSAHMAHQTLITLQDNGKGYTGDLLSLGKLFEKGPNSKGNGIGLYLIQRLMKLMHGRVYFSNHNGFLVKLGFYANPHYRR